MDLLRRRFENPLRFSSGESGKSTNVVHFPGASI